MRWTPEAGGRSGIIGARGLGAWWARWSWVSIAAWLGRATDYSWFTDHAHLIALNRFNGELLWETEMANWRQNYDGTSAPLVVGNLVIA